MKVLGNKFREARKISGYLKLYWQQESVPKRLLAKLKIKIGVKA
ncbi:hypothetical protein [Enterococcus rivorum]